MMMLTTMMMRTDGDDDERRASREIKNVAGNMMVAESGCTLNVSRRSDRASSSYWGMQMQNRTAMKRKKSEQHDFVWKVKETK